MRTLDSVVRVVAVGLAVSAVAALLGVTAGAAMGMETLHFHDLTPRHVVVASAITNVAGAAFFVAIRKRIGHRAVRVYVLLAFALATLASVKVALVPPAPGFAPIATVIHFVVAAVSSTAIPWFFAHEPTPTFRFATRALVTLVGLVTSLAPEIADFNGTHLENPQWSAHARYHGVLLACAMVAVGTVSIALMWRPSPPAERRLRVALAAGLPAAIWGGFFVALAFPDASSWPDGASRPMVVAPNVFVAGALVILAAVGWWLDRSAPRVPRSDLDPSRE